MSDLSPGTTRVNSRRVWLGIALTLFALLCHVLAARAIGGSVVAYRDHLLGFALIAVVSCVLVAPVVWKFWRGRHDLTVLWCGVIQAVLGVFVYIERFSVHG